MNTRNGLERIAAFSDGVFAIACTLLILELKVPHLDAGAQSGALWPALRAVWPSIVAYFISFESILVAWAAHHRALNLLTGSSKAFLFANGLLLLTITFMPFPTAVLAEYINTPQANIAVMFFSATWLAANLAFNVWWSCMFAPVRIMSPAVSQAVLSRTRIQMFGGLTAYAATTVMAYWFPIAALAVIMASQFLWITIAFSDDEFSSVGSRAK